MILLLELVVMVRLFGRICFFVVVSGCWEVEGFFRRCFFLYFEGDGDLFIGIVLFYKESFGVIAARFIEVLKIGVVRKYIFLFIFFKLVVFKIVSI